MSTSKKPTTDRITIGKIVGTHGVRGTMKIYPLTDFPERFLSMRALTLEQAGRKPMVLPVKSMTEYEGKGVFFFTSGAIDNKEDAEALRGAFVTIDSDERVDLEDGAFWIDDIRGMEVFDAASGEKLGEVADVLQTGSNDVYEVRKPDGSPGMIPAITSVVLEVDVARKAMKVSLPEGLWD